MVKPVVHPPRIRPTLQQTAVPPRQFLQRNGTDPLNPRPDTLFSGEHGLPHLMPHGEDMSRPAFIMRIQSSTQIQPLGNHDRYDLITTRPHLNLERGVAQGTMERLWGFALRRPLPLPLAFRPPPHLPLALRSLKPAPPTRLQPPPNNRIHRRRMQTSMPTDPDQWQPTDMKLPHERPILHPETETRLSTGRGRSTNAHIYRQETRQPARRGRQHLDVRQLVRRDPVLGPAVVPLHGELDVHVVELVEGFGLVDRQTPLQTAHGLLGFVSRELAVGLPGGARRTDVLSPVEVGAEPAVDERGAGAGEVGVESVPGLCADAERAFLPEQAVETVVAETGISTQTGTVVSILAIVAGCDGRGKAQQRGKEDKRERHLAI